MKSWTRIIAVSIIAVFCFASLTWAEPPKAPVPGDTVKALIGQFKPLGEAKHENLTIIPVGYPDSKLAIPIKTLDEVIGTGKLVVTETSASGEVNRLFVANDSDDFVFIMAGEIIAGAKQDRILKEDILLPPKSGKKAINAFCVEQGRWTKETDKFYSRGRNANIATRQAAKSYQSQMEVWRGVAQTNDALDQRKTTSLSGAFESEKFTKDKDAFLKALKDVQSAYPRAKGVVVLINGKVVAADIFADARLFQRFWAKLLDSYIVEAVSRRSKDVESGFADAASLFNEAQKADMVYRDSQGAGKIVDIQSPSVAGSGLLYTDTIIHLDLFPKLKAKKVTPQVILPPSERRNR